MIATLTRYYRLLATYLKPVWRKVVLLAVVLFANTGLQLLNPLLLRRFIDSAGHGAVMSSLITIALMFIAVAVILQFLSVLEAYLAEDVGWTATNNLRTDLMHHLLDLDLGFHSTHVPGELIQRLDYDTATLANFFSRFILRVVASLLLLGGVLLMLARIDQWIGMIFACFVALAIVVLRQIQRRALPFAKADLATMGTLFGYLEERLTGTEDIRARGAGEYVMRGLYTHMRARLEARRNAGVMFTVLVSTVSVLAALGTALAYSIGGYRAQHGTLTVGTVFAIVSYVALVTRPLAQLTQQVQDLQQATAGLARVEELRDTPSAIQDGSGAPFPPGPLSVKCMDVTFTYGTDSPALQEISFAIEPGMILGILGRTGSGKSTLARLLLRLYDPMIGTICLGGVDLRATRQADIRTRVSLVTQEVQLFHASVRENVTLFDPAIPDARIVETLRLLGLHDWYATLPAGLDTQLAGGNVGLSAGEAQLLAFARAFLKAPDVVILDEASSRLDPSTERRIERAIDVLLAGRTGIIVAHRLGTIARADVILILEDGRIVERGNRVVLAADATSQYASLLRMGQEVVA